MEQTPQPPIRPLQVPRAHQCLNHPAPIAASQHGDQEAEKGVNDVALVKVLEYGEIPLSRVGQHEAQEGGEGVHGRHPENGDDLPLDERLVHPAQMSGHVEESEEAGEEGEGAGHVQHGEVALLLHLVLDVLRGALQLLLQRVDLALLAGQAEGVGLCLEEEEGRGHGEQGDASVVEQAVDAPC